MARIIGGRFRGHPLNAPTGTATRPTSDRVREAVFSTIVSWLGRGDRHSDEALRGLAFLDLYAGTGAMGLEAASRGCEAVRLVEKDARVASFALQNAKRLGARVTVTRASVGQVVGAPADQPYDVVWLDPPYALGNDELLAVTRDLLDHGWLAPSGLLVVERSSRDPAPDLAPILPDVWQRRYGETTIYYATRGESE